ncbi:MAG: recombination regulator RecX [Legionella sp.]|jgi:regulatory protein
MSKAFDCAMRLLSRREHGALELCKKLERKGFTKDEAQQALDLCQELDVQSDTRFIESYSRSRIRQGYGPVKIIQELKIRGIDAELIHKVFGQEQHDWHAYALEVWQKKTRGVIADSLAEKHKQQQFLLYRGFESDVIVEVFNTK